MENLEDIRKRFISELTSASDLNRIHDLSILYLGRNGVINGLMKNILKVSPENRKKYGMDINAFKLFVQETIHKKEQEYVGQTTPQNDATYPGTQIEKGSLHITTLATEEITRIFEKIGFTRMSYPEVEWEYFAFETLNMPKTHPARDDFETFFIEATADSKRGKMVLTPHTSSGQNREMKRVKTPPIRMINIAKTYRKNWDATHTPMFHQFEGLCVDTHITIANLIGTIEHFAKEFFGHDRKIRLRPFHFMFTEPSFEIDVSCGLCKGTGKIDGIKCKVCKSGWLELGGAGMVHPNVLEYGGIDSKQYSGWAFGFGPERCFMMKKGISIDDIRILYSNNIRFLEQF